MRHQFVMHQVVIIEDKPYQMTTTTEIRPLEPDPEAKLLPVPDRMPLKAGDLLPTEDGGFVRVINPRWPEGEGPFCERVDSD